MATLFKMCCFCACLFLGMGALFAQTVVPSTQVSQVSQQAKDRKIQENQITHKQTENKKPESTKNKNSVKKNEVDPYETFNRAMFRFNDKLDQWFLKPAATAYNKIMPSFLNKALDHFFANILVFPTILNDILQVNFYQTVSDSWRLAINTTIGVGGFFDMATPMGLPYNSEDFGLTLARWGYKDSTFLMLPFFGPRTIRDSFSIPFNIYASAYLLLPNVALRNSIYGLQVIDDRARLLRFQGVYEQVAIDPYVFLRTSYLQRRKHQIERNEKLSDPYTAQDMQNMQEDYYLDE